MRPLRVVLAALLLEDDDLFPAGLADDGRDDRSTRYRGAADLRLFAADHQNFTERNLVLIRAAEDVALDLETVARGNAILLSTGTNDGVHNVLQEKVLRCDTPALVLQRPESRARNEFNSLRLKRIPGARSKKERRPKPPFYHESGEN